VNEEAMAQWGALAPELEEKKRKVWNNGILS